MKLVVAVIAALLGGSAAAQTPAHVAGTTATPALQDQGSVQVCKRQEVTGSRLGTRRVCKSKAEWEAEARAAREQLGRIVDGGQLSQPRGN